MEGFFKVASQYVDLTPASKQALASIVQCRTVTRGTIILRPNSVCNHIHFVESGLLRTFYEMDGRDITDWLSPEDTFSCSILSYISRLPDRRGIEALENSTLSSLQYYELEHLYLTFPDIERLGRQFYGLGITMVQQRFDALHFHTALERYQHLMHTRPTLIQRTPLNMLASYLGITKETLSRIRSQYVS